MSFWLKKFISFWLMPLPCCLALIVAGWWMTGAPRHRRAGRILIGVGAAVLLLLSNNFASMEFLSVLERRYPPIGEIRPGQPLPAALASCRFIAVLGGGHAAIAALPAASRLSPASLGRLVEGVRLARLLPRATLIVSGPSVHGEPSHASVLAAAAASLGVDPSRIRLVDTARDTEGEARAVEAIAGDAPVALVTSAWHMPRAAADFRAAGVAIVPCPADFEARLPDRFHLSDLSWDAESLSRSTAAVHEGLGNLWMALRRAL